MPEDQPAAVRLVSHGAGIREADPTEDRNEAGKQQAAGLASHTWSSTEEISQEQLVQRIMRWSKIEDDGDLANEVRQFGARLERMTSSRTS